jgi:excisionase family DNA binding protein
MTEPATWLTLNEAAAYARFHRTTLGDAVRAGRLRGYQVDGGHWRIHRDDIDAWIRGEQAPARPAPTITRKQRSA